MPDVPNKLNNKEQPIAKIDPTEQKSTVDVPKDKTASQKITPKDKITSQKITIPIKETPKEIPNQTTSGPNWVLLGVIGVVILGIIVVVIILMQ